MRIIDATTVRKLVSIGDTIPALTSALIRLSAGEADQQPRVTVTPRGHDGALLLMPAVSTGSDLVSLKLLSMFPRSAERGLPSVQGMVILIDGVYGEPLAIIDGTAVTEIRTAAVTAIATDRLAPVGASVLALIGAGVQARGSLEALGPIRPWRQIRIFSRTRERGERLCRWATDRGLPATVVDSPHAAVAGADVVCTATSACAPVLSDDSVAERGVHISAIGAFGPTCRELPGETVQRSKLFVDSREAVLREAGDILVPHGEGRLAGDVPLVEIGEVLAGRRGGRSDEAEVTIFKSVGLPIEDAVACDVIYQRALATASGHDIAFP